MIRLEEKIKVDRPIGEVFAYTSDFENLEDWDPGISTSKKLTRGPVGVGTEFEVVAKSGPRRIPMRYAVTAFDPPRKVVLEGKGGGIGAVDTISFEERGRSTELTYVADLSFSGLLARAEPFLKGTLERVGRDAITGLESALSGKRSTPEHRARNWIEDRSILPGMLGFSRFGYRRRKASFAPLSVSLEGRTIVVTGATSGLGRATADGLAGKGARVVLVGRNPDKLEATRREIVEETGNPEIGVQVADLSLLADVRRVAARLLETEPEIHVLVNNAGALYPTRGLTGEGIEKTLALDLLSPFLLTNLLLPRLKASRPARVVNVSSGGMYTQRIRVDDLAFEKGRYDGSIAYARAKRGLVILTEMWAEALEDQGVVVHSMHPGWADTPGVVSSLPSFYRVTKRILRTPEEGADTIVWLAASPEAEASSGRFWLDRQPHTTHVFPGTRESAQEREALLRSLCELTGWNLEPALVV